MRALINDGTEALFNSSGVIKHNVLGDVTVNLFDC